MSLSIRAIAKQAGVSPSTVSRALSGTGRVSIEVRENVKRIAAAAGYQIHPLLSRALSLSRQPETSRYRGTLAFILEYPTETGPDYQKAIQVAAEARALALAFHLDKFILSGKAAEHRRWSRIFLARGIRGLIIIPRLESSQPRLYFKWDEFAVVEIGRTVWFPPRLHRVDTSDYHNMLEAFHLLKKVGYRRIGMAIEPTQNHHQRGTYYAAYLLTQQRLPAAKRIPILGLEGGWNEVSFCQWVRKYKPDVLFAHCVTDVCVWLKKMKLRIPDDVSVFNINVRAYDDPGPHRNYDWSGLRRDYAGMGRRAVEMVATLLENNEIGLPGNPICIQVDQFWVPGKTLAISIADHISDDGLLRAPVLR